MRTAQQPASYPALRKALLFLLAIAVIAAAVFAAGRVGRPQALPAVAWQQDNSVNALSASTADLAADLATQQALLDALPATVLAAGCDTLYYTVNTADGVGWETRSHTPDPRLRHPAALGLVDTTFDALDYLAARCADTGVKLVAVLDVQALAGSTPAANALTEDGFATRLQGAVRELSEQYAISALVLSLPDAVADTAASRAVLSGIARQSRVPLGLELAARHPLLRAADTGMSLAVARVDASCDGADTAALAGRAAGVQVLWLAADPVAFSSAAYYAAGQGIPVNSCIWAAARTAAIDAPTLQALHASVDALKGTPAVMLPQPADGLAVSYPAAGATLYSERVFIMGTSDPAQPLTLDGEPVARSTKDGTFGVLVTLAKGENRFTFAQGGTQLQLTVHRAGYGGGGGSAEWDGSTKLYEGTRIRITEWLCSVLADPHDDGRITETAKLGGVAVVNRYSSTVRGGRKTYVYELATGGWVLSSQCQVVTENIGPWPLADLAATDDGRTETLRLVTGGTPLAYDSWDEENRTLTVTLANTTIPAEETRSLSGVFAGTAKLENVPGGVRLTLRLDGTRQLWGYDITYDEAGNTLLQLRGAPALPLTGPQPLAGAVVMLDPGHGQDDFGALGVAGGIGGAAEKDLNLAVATAAAARLRQLGATVVMTRQDDTFLTLEERSRLAKQVQPDLFLAVHHNSVELISDANRISGASAYYFTLPGKQLADCLLPRVADAAQRKNSGSSWSYFYVTRMTCTPAVLFEYGFLVNPKEYEACCDPLTILRQGEATAMGILDYFEARIR